LDVRPRTVKCVQRLSNQTCMHSVDVPQWMDDKRPILYAPVETECPQAADLPDFASRRESTLHLSGIILGPVRPIRQKSWNCFKASCQTAVKAAVIERCQER